MPIKNYIREKFGLNDNKILFGLFLILILLSSTGGIFQILEKGHPSGDDPIYHYKLINAWLRHENPLLNEKYFSAEGPYPPAFHITIAFLSKIFFSPPKKIMNILEVILFPLILISTFYLILKETDIYTSFLSICFLLLSIAFSDRARQVIPQAADVLLFPLAVYFFLENKKKGFLLISVFLIYNHGIYSLLLITSLLIYSVRYDGEKIKEFFKIGLFSLPLLIIMGPFLIRAFSVTTGTNSPQKELMFNNPTFAIFYFGIFLFISTMISLYFFKNKKRTRFENILILWIIVLLPLLPFYPDRFLSYVAQPIAIINGIIFADLLKRKDKRILFFIIMFFLTIIHLGIDFTVLHPAYMQIMRKWK